MPKKSAVFCVLSLTLGLAACGLKGGLEYRPGPAPEPLLGNPKPAPKAEPEKTAKDLNTGKESTR